MGLKAAKQLLHVEAWLSRVDEIVQRGKEDEGFFDDAEVAGYHPAFVRVSTVTGRGA